VKEKNNRILKGQTYTDRRKQRDWYDKSKIVSLTMHTDLMIITLAIEGYKVRVVGTGDVKGVYLHTN